MSYAPPGYYQIDGSSYEQQNCVPSVCTDLIDRVTVGALRIPAPVIRKDSGITTHRGISYLEATLAVDKATGGRVKLAARYGLNRTQVHDLAYAGFPFGISIDTSVTRYTPYHTGTFVGGHTVYVNGIGANALTFHVEDPGTSSGYMDWPADLLFRAAEKRGGGVINILVGRDTEGVNRVSVGTPLYDSPYRSSKLVRQFASGLTATVTNTVHGGGWPRADGGTSYGWHRVPGDLYAPGKGLR
jgi:hypothetical protein